MEERSQSASGSRWARPAVDVDLSGMVAFICDLDGVLTSTATTHLRAWTRMFDDYLRQREGEGTPLFTEEDYLLYVDGRPRYDGVDTFLRSRGIALPRGRAEDPPERETVCGLGNRKNEYFREMLEREGVERIEPSIDWLRRAKERGLRLGVVTSSRNAVDVLRAAGIEDLFEVRIDGLIGSELGLPGKPEPAYFLEAARRMGVDPRSAAVVEDAESGVEAGRRGGFGLVIGIAAGAGERLLRAGADIVVDTLARLPLPPSRQAAA